MFLDPFEEKKKRDSRKPTILPKIIADIHEKDSMIFSVLKSSDINLEITSLKIGDFLISDTIIERKTINDFISSMINKRLIEQLDQLTLYPKRLLIIEGRFEDIYKDSKINPNAIKGFILSILTRHSTPIIFTKDYSDTANYLIILAKQQLKNKQEISLHSRIPKTKEEQKQYILEAFPNIGPKKAEQLIKRFSTLKEIFNADEDGLKEILKSNTKGFLDILD